MRKLLPLLLLGVLAGCAMGQTVRNDIRIGMTKEQVIAVMGRPDGIRKSGESEALEYANGLVSGWSWDRADYYIILKDGKVTSYGPGEVRQESPGVLILVPVR